MQLNPLVSVIIPVYNAEKYIEEALLSILRQTYTNIEIIIIDDGSKDESEKIIKNINAKNIQYVKNVKNIGVSATRNRGFELAKGKYIALMDADDISLPTRIEKQVTFLEKHHEYGLVSSHYESFREHIFGVKRRIRKLSTEPEKIHTSLLFTNMLCCPSTMIRKEVLIKHDLHFDTSLQMAEDFDLWRRLSVVTKITNIDEVLLKYRKHKNNSIKNRTILDRDYTRVIIKSFKRLEIDIEELFDDRYRLKNIESFLKLNMYLEMVLEKNRTTQNYHPIYLEQTSSQLMHWMFKKHIKEFGYTLFSVYRYTHAYTIKPLSIKESNLFLRGYYQAKQILERSS